jgi:hypothetical protein
VLDTRAGPSRPIGYNPDGSPIGPAPPEVNRSRRFKVGGQTFGGFPAAGAGRFTFPAEVTGIRANGTILQPEPSGGFATVFPGDVPDQNRPNASTVNPSTGVDQNFVAPGSPLPPSANPGTLAVDSTNSRHVVVDALGVSR